MVSNLSRLWVDDIEEAKQKARQEALQEGRQEGRQEERQKMIRAMVKAGATFEFVAKAAEMSVDEVKKIIL